MCLRQTQSRRMCSMCVHVYFHQRVWTCTCLVSFWKIKQVVYHLKWTGDTDRSLDFRRDVFNKNYKRCPIRFLLEKDMFTMYPDINWDRCIQPMSRPFFRHCYDLIGETYYSFFCFVVGNLPLQLTTLLSLKMNVKYVQSTDATIPWEKIKHQKWGDHG